MMLTGLGPTKDTAMRLTSLSSITSYHTQTKGTASAGASVIDLYSLASLADSELATDMPKSGVYPGVPGCQTPHLYPVSPQGRGTAKVENDFHFTPLRLGSL